MYGLILAPNRPANAGFESKVTSCDTRENTRTSSVLVATLLSSHATNTRNTCVLTQVYGLSLVLTVRKVTNGNNIFIGICGMSSVLSCKKNKKFFSVFSVFFLP